MKALNLPQVNKILPIGEGFIGDWSFERRLALTQDYQFVVLVSPCLVEQSYENFTA